MRPMHYLIKAFMGVLDTCKAEEDPFKNEGAKVVIKRSPIVRLCRFLYDAAAISTV